MAVAAAPDANLQSDRPMRRFPKPIMSAPGGFAEAAPPQETSSPTGIVDSGLANELARRDIERPDWRELALTGSELHTLPTAWRAALAQWRGIYLIHDVVRRASYVGSAGGADNILGRWLGYAATGHGGNRELVKSDPVDLRFSILERTSPDLDLATLAKWENNWKQRLLTREFGFNAN